MAYEILPPELFKKLKYISLGLVYAIFAFWFLLNGPSVFDYWDANWTYSIIFYIIGVCIFLTVIEKLPTDLKKPVGESFFGFLIGFPLFTVIFMLMSDAGLWFQNLTPLPTHMILPTMVYQIGIVAASEATIFRSAIFRTFHKINPYVGYFVASALFAGFHYAAYGGSFSLTLIAFCMGLILAYLVEKYNIGVAVGFHSAWNCIIIIGWLS